MRERTDGREVHAYAISYAGYTADGKPRRGGPYESMVGCVGTLTNRLQDAYQHRVTVYMSAMGRKQAHRAARAATRAFLGGRLADRKEESPGASEGIASEEQIANARVIALTRPVVPSKRLPAVVREFHMRYGHAVRTTPTARIADAEARFRLRLIAEEFFELLDAVLHDQGGLSQARDLTFQAVDTTPVWVDLPAAADAMSDLDWVVEGTRAVFGIPGAAVLAEVARANMEKMPTPGPDGLTKPTKPPTWNPPDIAAVLRRHGWDEREGT